MGPQPKQHAPTLDSILTKVGVTAVLVAFGLEGRPGTDVAKAIDQLGARMEKREDVIAAELKEMRTELVATTRTLVAAVEQIREHDRRIESLETQRSRARK